MRVLLLVSSSSRTGAAEGLISIARWLREHGHDAKLAVDTRTDGDVLRWMAEARLPPPPHLHLSRQTDVLDALADMRALARLVRKREVDVLHANMSHDHHLCMTASRLGPRPREVRVVRTAHRRVDLAGAARLYTYRRTDGVVAPCESYGAALVRSGIPKERVAAIPGAVDSHRFSPGESSLRQELGLAADAPVAGIVARMKDDRGHAELIDAFAAVHRELPKARLVVFGRGEAETSLRTRAAPLGEAVIFGGYRRDAELVAAYRTLDVAVWLREGNDGTCRGVLEAMACGVPVVAGDDGASAELVEGGGLTVAAGDKAAIALALVSLLGDPSRRAALGQAGRERARTFTEARRAEAHLELYARIRELRPA